MPTPGTPPSAIWNGAVDQPLVQDANYRLTSTDRAYIDSQIRGTQALALQAKTGASYFSITQSVTAGGTIASAATAGAGTIVLTGTPSAAFTYTLPAGPGQYQIVNNSTQTATVQIGASSTTVAAGKNVLVSTDGTTIYVVSGTGATQVTTALSNGLNSNVVVGGQTSVRFGSYTGPVILGGILSSAQSGGTPLDISFTVSGQPVTIRNLDASSTSANRIVTGTGGDVFLPLGQTSQCRLLYDATLGHYILQANGVHQVREYNVLDWGFDATGTNANDTAIAALAASITASLGSAATAAGGTARIFFPYGTYLFANTWPTFPFGTIFEGSGSDAQTTLSYTGTGTFISAPNYSEFKYLLIEATGTLNNAAPSLANIIQVLSSGIGGTYEVETAIPHNYVNGDLVGIYGTGTTADCDPALPWTIANVTANTFTLTGSTYASGYIVTTHTVNAASNAVGGPFNPIVVGTTTAHGLLNGQLCWINGVLGNTAANGLMRVYGNAPGDTTTFPIAINLVNNVQGGNGAYASGGTVYSGGCCLLYSRVALIGISVQESNGSSVRLKNVDIWNFKYSVSWDGAELCSADDFQFGSSGASVGYTSDQQNNDGVHSSAAVRVGGFVTITPGVANDNYLDRGNIFAHYAGVYHHDGYGHYVTRCNFENRVVAIISNSNIVEYKNCTNDGSDDQVGLFQFIGPYGEGLNGGPLTVRDSGFTNTYGPCVYLEPGHTLLGLILDNVTFDSTFPAIGGGGTVQPLSVIGFQNSYNGPIGTIASLPNNVGSQTVHTGGTTVNHTVQSAGALDVGYYPLAGTSPAAWPAILVRDPLSGTVFYQKSWTPLSGFGEYYGVATDVTDISNSLQVVVARRANSIAWDSLAPSGTDTGIGLTPLPSNVYTAGSILMQVSALDTATGNMARWSVRRLFSGSGSVASLGQVVEAETFDAIGLTPPIMVLSGVAGAQNISASIYGGAHACYFNVVFDLDGLGQ